MKTFETPKVVELGTLQQIVLSSGPATQKVDPATATHLTNDMAGS